MYCLYKNYIALQVTTSPSESSESLVSTDSRASPIPMGTTDESEPTNEISAEMPKRSIKKRKNERRGKENNDELNSDPVYQAAINVLSKENDELDVFGQSVANDLRALRKIDQIQAKRQIQSVLLQFQTAFEWNELNREKEQVSS